MLRPPPPAVRVPVDEVSFHAISGIYESAEPPSAAVVVLHALVDTSRNSLPPMPVTYGKAAGISTANPRVAIFDDEDSQSAAPESPLDATIVMP